MKKVEYTALNEQFEKIKGCAYYTDIKELEKALLEATNGRMIINLKFSEC